MFHSPRLDHAPSFIERSKRILVQALISTSSVEAFDVSILVWFDLVDLSQFPISLRRLVEHRFTYEVGSVVATNNPR
jgi:hypothetical protein